MPPPLSNSPWVSFIARWQRRKTAPATPAVYSARLPSDLPGACFAATIFVYWAPGRQDAVTDAQVHQQLVTEASDVTGAYSALQTAEAHSAVIIALNRIEALAGYGVHLGSISAEMHAYPAAIELADQRQQLIRETTLACEKQKEEAKRLTFLSDHILNSSHMTRLWWLDNDPAKLVKLGEVDGAIEKAVDVLADHAKKAEPREQIAELIEIFLRGLIPESRNMLITQIANVFAGYDRTDLAERLNGSRS